MTLRLAIVLPRENLLVNLASIRGFVHAWSEFPLIINRKRELKTYFPGDFGLDLVAA